MFVSLSVSLQDGSGAAGQSSTGHSKSGGGVDSAGDQEDDPSSSSSPFLTALNEPADVQANQQVLDYHKLFYLGRKISQFYPYIC